MSQRNFRGTLALSHNRRIRWQPFPAGQINCQTDEHADACGAEAVMPAVNLAECASDQRRCDYSSIDKYVVDLESVRASVVARCVQRADLAGEISLETTNAGEQTEQREEERHVERHQKMSGRHEQRTDCDCACASQHTVGNQSAADRREINETSVESENCR